MSAVDELAAESLRLATVAPDRARELAQAAERDARRERAWAAASVAARALGVAQLQLRNLDASTDALRSSVAAARRAGSARLAGEARMSLSATLGVRGSPAAAMRAVDAALHDLTGVAAARARTQRAALLQVLGRDDEALEELRRALPALRQAGDVQWQTRALSNRSLLLTARRAFAAAEADLQAALHLCTAHELDLPAAYAEQNLGCLKASQGEVAAALAHFDGAATRYARLGMRVGSLLVDRGMLLLSVRLVEEAREAAEAAVLAHAEQKRDLHLPDARLLLSTVALVQGDVATARQAAQAAAQSFRRLHRRDGIALARWARLQAALVGDPGSVTPAAAGRCADELAAVGWVVPALEARVLAGRLALERGRLATARAHLQAASRARHTGPADARARAWLAEALLREADGRRRAAAVALSTGLRVVEEHQATLGATELRAHVSVHRGGLARTGLRMALEDRDARRALAWAERGRAAALRLRPLDPPADPQLAAALADLRRTMAEQQERRAAGLPARDLLRRQVQLERSIAERCRMQPAGSGCARVEVPTVAALSARLADAALVEYVELDGTLHAVTLAGGRTRLHELGAAAPVRQRLDHLTFAMRRLAAGRPTAAGASAVRAVIDDVGRSFDDLLLRPLQRDLGQRPLVVAPTGALQSLPWSMLPSCRGRAVCVAPSASLWHEAAQRRPPAPGAPVVVVAGPGLPGARDEAVAVAALHRGSRLLLDGDATAAAVSGAMDGAALAHVAAHGLLRSDNPLLSSLLLADGPLTVYDLERLGGAPHQVVLAACDTARSHVVAGDETLGLAAALLGQGTATLVAPVVPVPDAATCEVMRSYHAELVVGRSAAQALATAQTAVAGSTAAVEAAAASFVCVGQGHGAPAR